MKTFERDGFSIRAKVSGDKMFYCLYDITKCLNIGSKGGNSIKEAMERAFKRKMSKVKIGKDEFSFIDDEQLEYFLRLYSTSADFNAFIREIPYWYKSQEAKEAIAKESKVVEPQAKSVPSVVEKENLPTENFSVTQCDAKVFSFNNFDIETIFKNGEPFFRLRDIVGILDISRTTASNWIANKWFDDDEIVDVINYDIGRKPLKYVAESGLYRILNRTNSPKARPFRQWLTKDVLPSLRKNIDVIAKDKYLPQCRENCLQTFAYNGGNLDYGLLNGEPIFNLLSICRMLNIINPHTSIDTKDEDYVIMVSNSKLGFTYFRNLANRGELFLTEAGLYRLLLRSNKTEAEKFSKWVTKEVLPSIRKTGSYQVEQKPAIPQTYAEALLEAGRLALENEKLQAQAIKNAPKVVAYDKLMDTHNSISVKEFGKIIGMGEKNLFKWLRESSYLMSDNKPYQRYIDRGYFEVVEKTCDIDESRSKSYTQTLITPKGQGYLSNKLKDKRG